MDARAIDRFWAKVDRSGGPDACWLWLAHVSVEGYGRFQMGAANQVQAHRISYELANGPIPDGLQMDHLCRNRACVNPSHLEAVTQRENILRGQSPAAQYARRDRCIRGHLFDESNTYIRPDNETRTCLACRNIRRARYRSLGLTRH